MDSVLGSQPLCPSPHPRSFTQKRSPQAGRFIVGDRRLASGSFRVKSASPALPSGYTWPPAPHHGLPQGASFGATLGSTASPWKGSLVLSQCHLWFSPWVRLGRRGAQTPTRSAGGLPRTASLRRQAFLGQVWHHLRMTSHTAAPAGAWRFISDRCPCAKKGH